MKTGGAHLAYCTNIHPAEGWEETRAALATHALAVRDRLRASGHLAAGAPFGIGLRLSARAASELEDEAALSRFREWLAATNCYVFTINGFPYGDFHGAPVKERVFMPDWTDPARVEYTMRLFRILAAIAPHGEAASVSTLPGSHKTFRADESAIRRNLVRFAGFLEELSAESGRDLHLGLEPEPLGHFENTSEALAFFGRLLDGASDPGMVRQRIGLNYDTCHFALEYEDAGESLDRLCDAGVRLSKIQLSSALALDPPDPAAMAAAGEFDEPVYSHQVVARRADGTLERYADLAGFLAAPVEPDVAEARVHFHIPLDTMPGGPLRSTRSHVDGTLAWWRGRPDSCGHFEIETYTWKVLPAGLARSVEDQIAAEYRSVLSGFSP